MPEITIITGESAHRQTVPDGGFMDESLLELGYLIERQCAGKGTCGRCRIKAEGNLSPPTQLEVKALGKDEIAAGWRLACQAEIIGDVKVTLAEYILHTDKVFGKIPDEKDLPEHLGLAVDLGTTTVGVFLVESEHYRVLAGNAVLNHQTSLGADVISRLEAASRNPVEPRLPARLAMDSIEDALHRLLPSKGIISGIKKVIVVGNTAMHHLLLGLDTSRLMVSPFQPSVREALVKKGFIKSLAADVEVLFPPVIGGFVGSDALACIVYFGIGRKTPGPTMAIDLGTNGEVMIGIDGTVYVSSTAAGPAFEGVNISCGMRATPGAVISASWEGESLTVSTIGALAPQGLAGSGLLSVIRRLRDRGVIEPNGRINDPELDTTRLVFRTAEGKAVKLPGELILTQEDVRELQKAKGAVRACADILLKEAGIAPKDLERVYLTGSFGGRLDVEDVLSLGVLPPVNASIIKSIPNGAGLGAALMLDDEMFEQACEIARNCRHVELFDIPIFMDRYIDSMSLVS